MNVANLQIEGLVMAIASVNHLLVQRGILLVEEIDKALRIAEANITGDERENRLHPGSEVRDLARPIRVLQLANLGQSEESTQSFSELAKLVGRTKEPYNEQR